MSGYTHSGSVYFAVVGQYVKIGYTAQPVAKRMKSLFSTARLICPPDMVPAEPSVVHVLTGCVMRDERRLHGLFAASHVAGEWFRYDDAFREHLAGLDYVTYTQSLSEFRRVRRALRSHAVTPAGVAPKDGRTMRSARRAS